MVFSENGVRYAPTQIRPRLRIIKMMRQRYGRPTNRFRIEHWLRLCKNIHMFFYSLRFYAYAKFENLNFWVISIVDKLHIKLMLFAWTFQKSSYKGHLWSLKVTYKFEVILGQISKLKRSIKIIYPNEAFSKSFSKKLVTRTLKVTQGQKSPKRHQIWIFCIRRRQIMPQNEALQLNFS